VGDAHLYLTRVPAELIQSLLLRQLVGGSCYPDTAHEGRPVEVQRYVRVGAYLARLPTAQGREEGDSVGAHLLDAGQTGHRLAGLVHSGHAGKSRSHLRRLSLGGYQPVLEDHVGLVVDALLLAGYVVHLVGNMAHVQPKAAYRSCRPKRAPNLLY